MTFLGSILFMWFYMLPETIVFIFLFIIGYLVSQFLYKRSNKIGLKKQITSLPRWASQTKPILGGVSFYFVMLIGLFVSIVWFSGEYNFFNVYNIVLFFSITIGFVMGLADDLLNTSPYFKFIMQFVVALIFIFSGYYIKFFDNIWLNYFTTVVWVVGIMNSINMLDNMDAITTSVSLVIIAGISFISIVTANFEYGIIPYVILPALIAFLNFNWHPSKMYMGDNGSQLLGALLAGAGIFFVWNHEFAPSVTKFDTVLSVALMFILPLTDTTTVTINRLLKGVSPFKGDKNHTTHNLVYAGLSEQMVAIVFLFISLVSTAIAVAILTKIWTPNNFARILITSFTLVVFLSLYINTKIKHNENKSA
jgi:UDP-GlcNAc:undecaprenyl-phosphate GlcNAc-1-phosphate transferase